MLAEYYAVHGKANRIARKIVSKIPPQPHKKSYTFDKFVDGGGGGGSGGGGGDGGGGSGSGFVCLWVG